MRSIGIIHWHDETIEDLMPRADFNFEDRQANAFQGLISADAQMREYHQKLDRVCVQALAAGCGVRIDHLADGVIEMRVDPEVPAATIHEHRP